jgi:hypothetical protein
MTVQEVESTPGFELFEERALFGPGGYRVWRQTLDDRSCLAGGLAASPNIDHL